MDTTLNAILESFSIKNLYGERDVEIQFSSNVMILVAENGYGKTTVLNSLYAVLSGNISKLRKIDFELIEIKFSDGESFKIRSSDLKISTEALKKHGIFDHLFKRLGESTMHDLIETALALPKEQFKRSSILQVASRRVEIPASHLANMMDEVTGLASGDMLTSQVKEELGRINSKFPYNIVYLPTYRRVEQGFKELSLDGNTEFFDDHSINFGMSNVDRRFKEITKEIITSSVEWFSKVNGQMLSQLVEGFKVDSTVKESIDDPGAIKIVLDRIGSNIEESYKKEIIRLIETKEIFSNHDPLLYFISNLVKVYAQQQSNDNAIQDFSEVCNRYLADKKIDYNESSVTIDIVRRKNNRPVNIESLSSGEKQIISLFARLYLSKEDDLAIFFDEPELSLSIEWQKTLLPDILNSGKCVFMFTTTHSPFVFENNLVNHTVDLGTYIKEL